MAKPNRKKAARKAKAPRPEPTIEELKQEIAKFDGDGDGHIGGSRPKHPEAIEEAAPTAEPVTEEAVETPAPADRVSLGPVECRMKRLSTKVVLGLLSPEGLRRVEAENDSASSESLRQRALVTDGRAAPVVFEDGRGDVPPSLLHGYGELAAAVATGVQSVSVLLVPAGGAAEAQAHIVEMVRQTQQKQASPDDDDLFYRVHAAD